MDTNQEPSFVFIRGSSSCASRQRIAAAPRAGWKAGPFSRTIRGMPQTLVEKIATMYAVGLEPGQLVRAGDFVTIRPKHVMTHDNTGAVIPKFKQIGATKIQDPRQ